MVNNSWGRSITDDLYEAMVKAWAAAGIVPVFANGNDGPGCGTVGRPAMYPDAFGVGAHNSSNNIANFSSRGPAPAPFSVIKPNITAPGQSVRSSTRNGGYGSSSGTSMAAPHVAGAVALVWSADPSMVGRVAETMDLLERTATPVSNLTCGGTPEHNNVWGHGRLNVYAAVQELLQTAPALTVTTPEDGLIVTEAQVTVAGQASDDSGPVTVTVNGEPVALDEDGNFSTIVDLVEGENTITVVARNAAGLTTTVTRTVIADLTPVYEVRVNVGGGEYTDSRGNAWAADRAYDGAHGFGHVGGKPRTTKKAVSGTPDPALYQSQQEALTEYRFDVPQAGWYEVTLHFAELQHNKPDKRLFSVAVEDGLDLAEAVQAAIEALTQPTPDVEAALAALRGAGLTNYDIVATVGDHTADSYTFRVYVSDGQLNVYFRTAANNHRAVLNAAEVRLLSPWRD